MKLIRNRYNEVLSKAYLNTLQLEETKRKFSRTATTFRGRKAMEYIYAAQEDGKGFRTQSELADFLRISRPSCTTLVHKLEKQGYVFREKNSADERSVGLFLTRRGRLVTAFQCQHRNDVVDAVMAEYSSEEKEILFKGFVRLNEMLESCSEALESGGKEKKNEAGK